MNKCAAIVLLLIVSALPAAAAKGEEGEVELGIYAGQTWPDDYGILNPGDDLLAGARIGWFFSPQWSVELSGQMFSSETEFPAGATNVDFEVQSFRINALRNFRPGQALRPFLTFGMGPELADVDDGAAKSKDIGVNGGAGLRWFFTDHFGLRLDGRYATTKVGDGVDHRENNLEGTLGLLFTVGGKPPGDADGDGVNDRKDKCPNTPRGATVDETGCPKDADGDLVFDGLDKCPGTPRGVPVDASGCPKDTDGDGVHDGLDKCPDTPRGATVDSSGCPKDTDGDGVFDGIDKCPDTPRGVKVDASGCSKDTDGDGVLDGIDKCPDTPRGAKVDATGCPIQEPKIAAPLVTPLVLEGVNFKTDSAEINAAGKSVLDVIANALVANPDVKVDIAGHTDSSGSDAHNLKLSQARADSVAQYLTSKGVPASRLTAKGYGETRPVADNATADGRSRNRRVELSRKDK